MIGKLLPLTLALVLASQGMFAAHASQRTDAKRAIAAIVNAADSAASRKDAAGAVAYYDNPAVQGAVRKGLSNIFAKMTTGQFTTEIVSVDIPGPFQAVVVSKKHFQGLLKTKSGKIGLAASEALVREYWIQRGPGWTAEKMRVLKIHRSFNSQPVKSF